jgi:uncharacterized protein DUF2785
MTGAIAGSRQCLVLPRRCGKQDSCYAHEPMHCTVLVLFAAALLAQGPAPAHSRTFWGGIAKNQYAVPPGSDVAGLTAELIDMLALPDPELRDEIAYSTLAAWIYQTRVIDVPALRPVIDRLLANLTDGVGEQGSDRIFRRSFSALTLSTVVARDNAAPFLTAEEFRRIENAAVAYLDAERDVRGYDPEHGWMHSAAHTADLLKFLARSRYLDRAGQTRMLDAIARKLGAAANVFTHGEDERLARAALSIVNRADCDRAAFAAWAERAKPVRLPEKPSLAQLSAWQNAKNFFAKLAVLLDAGVQPAEAVQSARDSVRAALKDAF